MPLFTDMLGREVVLMQQPQRIISIVPSQTELLYDLGLDEEVAGITKFCVHPESWFRTKARVGGTKTVNIDKVKALHPDLILANKEENTREQIAALEAVAPVWISDIKTLEEAMQMIGQVSVLTGSEREGSTIVAQLHQGFAALDINSGAAPKKTAYGIWYNPWMWAGGDTFISAMLEQCGWANALHDRTRYPAMDLAELVAYDPEIVLLSSEPFPFKERHIAEVQAALPKAKVLLADGEMFSWYGSRMLQAIPYFKSLRAQQL